MSVRVTHTIGDLTRDFKQMPRKAHRGFSKAVRQGAQKGATWARADAKKTAGTHGKHYPKSIRPEKVAPLEWVYGPLASMKQGNMNFEEGPGPQTSPHRNIEHSVPVARGVFYDGVDDTIDSLFW